MSDQPTKIIYTVREDIPEGTIVVREGEFVMAESDVSHYSPTIIPIGSSARDLKDGEAVLFAERGTTADITYLFAAKKYRVPLGRIPGSAKKIIYL